MELISVVLPTHYAVALINGDMTSDFTDIELEDIHNILQVYGEPLTISEYSYTITYHGLLTECSEYTFEDRDI